MIKKLVQRYAHSSKELIPGFRKTLPLFRFYQNMLPYIYAVLRYSLGVLPVCALKKRMKCCEYSKPRR